MKRMLWLLLLLPAILAASWMAYRAYTWDPDYILVQTLHYDLDHYKAPDEPLAQALKQAEGIAFKEGKKTWGERYVPPRQAYERLWQAFDDAGLPGRGVEFVFDPGAKENLTFSADLATHAAFIAWWRKHVDPSFQLRYPYYSLDESVHQLLPLPGSSDLAVVEAQAYNLNVSPPRREHYTSVCLSHWYLTGLHGTTFLIAPDYLFYKGPLWPLALILLSLPGVLIYFLRRPLLRILSQRRD